MRLWNKITRIITFERLLWCLATLMLCAIFLVIGLTAPSIPEFGKKDSTTVVFTDEESGADIESVVQEEPLGKVPINTATKEQLMTINGIGESFAERIIDYREKNGDFTDLAQLKNIEGIGEKRYQKWRQYLTLN